VDGSTKEIISAPTWSISFERWAALDQFVAQLDIPVAEIEK
jgi:hypothetical protein